MIKLIKLIIIGNIILFNYIFRSIDHLIQVLGKTNKVEILVLV